MIVHSSVSQASELQSPRCAALHDQAASITAHSSSRSCSSLCERNEDDPDESFEFDTRQFQQLFQAIHDLDNNDSYTQDTHDDDCLEKIQEEDKKVHLAHLGHGSLVADDTFMHAYEPSPSSTIDTTNSFAVDEDCYCESPSKSMEEFMIKLEYELDETVLDLRRTIQQQELQQSNLQQGKQQLAARTLQRFWKTSTGTRRRTKYSSADFPWLRPQPLQHFFHNPPDPTEQTSILTIQSIMKKYHARGFYIRLEDLRLEMATIRVQSWWRTIAFRQCYQRFQRAVLLLQWKWRGYLTTNLYGTSLAFAGKQVVPLNKLKAATSIQSAFRRYLARAHFLVTMNAIIRIQRATSIFVTKRRYSRALLSKASAFFKMSWSERRKHVHKEQAGLCDNATQLQAAWRRVFVYPNFTFMRTCVIKCQCLYRAFIGRRRYLISSKAALVGRSAALEGLLLPENTTDSLASVHCLPVEVALATLPDRKHAIESLPSIQILRSFRKVKAQCRHRDPAAKLVQATWRRFAAQQTFFAQYTAALTIQTFVRGTCARNNSPPSRRGTPKFVTVTDMDFDSLSGTLEAKEPPTFKREKRKALTFFMVVTAVFILFIMLHVWLQEACGARRTEQPIEPLGCKSEGSIARPDIGVFAAIEDAEINEHDIQAHILLSEHELLNEHMPLHGGGAPAKNRTGQSGPSIFVVDRETHSDISLEGVHKAEIDEFFISPWPVATTDTNDDLLIFDDAAHDNYANDAFNAWQHIYDQSTANNPSDYKTDDIHGLENFECLLGADAAAELNDVMGAFDDFEDASTSDSKDAVDDSAEDSAAIDWVRGEADFPSTFDELHAKTTEYAGAEIESGDEFIETTLESDEVLPLSVVEVPWDDADDQSVVVNIEDNVADTENDYGREQVGLTVDPHESNPPLRIGELLKLNHDKILLDYEMKAACSLHYIHVPVRLLELWTLDLESFYDKEETRPDDVAACGFAGIVQNDNDMQRHIDELSHLIATMMSDVTDRTHRCNEALSTHHGMETISQRL